MKNLIIIFLVALLTSSVSWSQSSCCTSAKKKKKECHSSSDISSTQLSDMSLYNLASDWTTSDGEVVKLESLKGKIQVVTMIYTTCEYACPRIMADLKIIEKSLKKYSADKVGFVLITMDPERDTPEKLKEFSNQHKLDKKRWKLLTGKNSDIIEIAALLKVNYKKEKSGEISHSNIITVLNTEGEISGQQEGLGVNPEPTIKAVESLLQKVFETKK